MPAFYWYHVSEFDVNARALTEMAHRLGQSAIPSCLVAPTGAQGPTATPPPKNA